MIKRILAGALCAAALLHVNFTIDCRAADAVSEARSVVGDITAYQLANTGSANVQEWINGGLSDSAATSAEWYAITLSQSGDYDFSSYISALNGYLSSNSVTSATSREKYALALAAVGDTDNPYITEVLDSSVGQQGIMSCIYGLHIINNGYSTANFNAGTVISELLSRQLDDGGWAIMGTMGDIDVTAMAIQSLAPYYSSDSSVKTAVNSALELLSSRQEDDGGYRSFGTANPESTAQVITALSAAGIDAASDSRFIKGGNTLFDGIMMYRLADGTFSHTLGGDSNATATVQVFYSLVSYIRMKEGKSPLFIFDSLITPETPTGNTVAPPSSNGGISHDTGNSQSGGTSQSGGDTSSAGTPDTSPDSDESTDIPQAEPSESTSRSGSPTVTRTTSAAVSSAVTTTAKPKKSEGTTTSSAKSAAQSTEKSSVTNSTAVSDAATSATSAEIPEESDDEGGGYKIWVVLGVVAAGGLVSAFLFAAGKRNYKNFIAVGAASAVIIAVVLATDIRSKDDYYSGKKKHKENPAGTVTMTIRCDTIAGISDSKYVPDDAVILDVTEFEIEDGETVYDILIEAAQTYGIQTENSGGADYVYISGINYIYELEYGDLSGWMYYVNDKSPSVSCDGYVLSDGDRIEWLYTCNIGNDLKQEVTE